MILWTAARQAPLSRVAKELEFQLSIIPSNEHPGLISFRMDWLDLLAVQGTFKSLLQHHSSKASILCPTLAPQLEKTHKIPPRDCSPGQAGKEGPQLARTGASQGFPRAAAPVGVFSRGTTTLGFSRQKHWSGLPFPSPMHESEK